jgi:hypothetical protein
MGPSKFSIGGASGEKRIEKNASAAENQKSGIDRWGKWGEKIAKKYRDFFQMLSAEKTSVLTFERSKVNKNRYFRFDSCPRRTGKLTSVILTNSRGLFFWGGVETLFLTTTGAASQHMPRDEEALCYALGQVPRPFGQNPFQKTAATAHFFSEGEKILFCFCFLQTKFAKNKRKKGRAPLRGPYPKKEKKKNLCAKMGKNRQKVGQVCKKTVSAP